MGETGMIVDRASLLRNLEVCHGKTSKAGRADRD
jgi:hypothetical protein